MGRKGRKGRTEGTREREVTGRTLLYKATQLGLARRPARSLSVFAR